MSLMTPAQARKAQLQKLLAQRVLARRRLLQFTQMTHPAYSAGWVHDDICRRLERFSQEVVGEKSPRLMLLLPPRHGKALQSDQVLPTPSGMRTHGSLKVGDFVYHPSGKAVRVLAVSPDVQVDVEVEFFDGTTVVCHENHEWTVYDRSRREWRTVETKYLESQKLVSGPKQRARFQIPLYNALEGAPQTLPLDPYFLGAWLGDGSSSGPVICGAEADLAHVVSLIPYPRGFRSVHKDTRVVYQGFVGGVRTTLRTHNLLNNKHIPEVYFLASVEQRRRLLAGLVDTDGSVEPGSQRVRFRSGSQRLAADVAHLVRTLGYRASVDYTPADTRERHIVGGESWCVQWTPHDGHGGGTLPRKAVARIRERRRVGIKAVRRTAPTEGQCIQVDSPDGLYLVGETYITTHNSELASIRFPAWHLGHNPTHEIINVGYNLELPMRFSRKVREVMRDPHYKAIFPDSQLDPDSQSVEAWNTTKGGGFTAAGVGGGITGKGCFRTSTRVHTRNGILPISDVRVGDEVLGYDHAEQRPQWTRVLAVHAGRLAGPARKHGSIWCTPDHELFVPGRGYVPAGEALAQGLPILRWEESSARCVVSSLSDGAGARRASVRDDGQDADARGAPYRPRPYEQRADEPYFSLEAGARVLSFTPGWSAGRVAELVRGEGEVTVDLQTTAGNLFVEGVLAHNCHILTIDDPIKNQEEADSILVRDKLTGWFESTAYTRLAPGGGVLLIQTVWNDDDLAGRLQMAMRSEEEGSDQYEIIKYPALSEHWEYRNELTQEILRLDAEIENPAPTITLLRPKDTCLHEDRYPTEALKRIRANLQPRIWSALYQQNPVPDEGMYFKKEYFRYQKALPSPNGLRIYTAWDFAIGEKQQNDWTVGATVLQDETDMIYVLEIFRMKGDSFQIVEAMLDVALRWGSIPTTGYLVGAEDGQIWRAIEPLLKKRMGERRQYPPYEVMRPMTDKLARARPLQGRMQQGRVVFPEGAAWLGQAEQELLRFPAGAHDDVVDALAWAAQLCMGKEPPRLAVPPPLPSWRDKLSIVGGQGSYMSA